MKGLEKQIRKEKESKERLQRECADQWSQVSRLKAEVKILFIMPTLIAERFRTLTIISSVSLNRTFFSSGNCDKKDMLDFRESCFLAIKKMSGYCFSSWKKE